MADEVILRAVAGSLKGEEFVFDEKGLCLIGRSNDCALQIPKEKDMRISRRHCLVILDPPNVRVRDLNSRNGTFVNNVRLQPGVIGEKPSAATPVDVVISDGDILAIGEIEFEFSIPSQKSAEPLKKPPPQGTKVIKLARPTKTHTGSLIPKADTGFFEPPSGNAAPVLDVPAPMTEAFIKPISPAVASGGAEAVTGSVTGAPPASGRPGVSSTSKPIRLGGGAADGGVTIVSPPGAASSNPIKLGAAVKPAAAAPVKLSGAVPPKKLSDKKVVSLTPPSAADLLAKRSKSDQQPPTSVAPAAGTPIPLEKTPKPPIKLAKPAVAQPQAQAANAPAQQQKTVAETPAPVPPKKPIILNRGANPNAAGDSGGDAPKPPLKAKLVGKKRENPDLTEVMDMSELSDDIALGADYIRKEKRKKRVTKFKIKGPK